MDLQPQMVVDALVKTNAAALARVHADLAAAVLEVATRWSDRFPDPKDMSGTTRCVSVRQTLLDMNDKRGPVAGLSLTMSEGPGMSVVLKDGNGTKIRVRKYPIDRLGERIRVVLAPPPGQRQAAAEAAQMMLDEGFDDPVFPIEIGSCYQLFVLWWPDSEMIGLDGAVLAAVIGIDDGSLVRILATAPLPAATTVGTAPTQDRQGALFEPLDDFDEFDDEASRSGDEPA